MAKHPRHILDMARKGAEQTYEELKAEITALIRNFPHLAQRKGRPVSPGHSARSTSGTAQENAPAPRRRKLSAKARKAISDAQKKRWAKVKAAEKK
jgi:hypothetical protein